LELSADEVGDGRAVALADASVGEEALVGPAAALVKGVGGSTNEAGGVRE